MIIDISEKELIRILNCFSFTLYKLKYHNNREDKNDISLFFDFDNYVDEYEDLKLMYRFFSTKGNRAFYNEPNNVFFIGQSKYLINKNYDFLQIVNFEKKENKIFKFFKNFVDKNKNIV